MAQQVLDLGRPVIRQAGVLPVELLHQRDGVPRTVEEVRVAERDVPDPRRDLLPDVLKHDVALHDPERPAGHRDAGAMAPQVLAATGGLDVARAAPTPIPRRYSSLTGAYRP